MTAGINSQQEKKNENTFYLMIRKTFYFAWKMKKENNCDPAFIVVEMHYIFFQYPI